MSNVRRLVDNRSPKESLIAGAALVAVVLTPLRFSFALQGEGHGSGGAFAWGAFVRDDRQLELHCRGRLGMVSYHAAGEMATHEAYMRELGVWDRCEFPGFSSEHLQAFRALAHDLQFASDFLAGDAAMLLSAAHREAVANAVQAEKLRAGYVGDTREIENMRGLFKERRYAEVVAVFARLKFPHLLSQSELRLVQLARQRAGA